MRMPLPNAITFCFAVFGIIQVSSTAPFVVPATNLDIWAEAGERRVAANPVSFRVRCETQVGWKVSMSCW